MAAIRFDIRTKELDAAIARTAGRLQNLRPVMVQVGEYMLLRTSDRFRSETAPDGTPWAPLSAAYLKWKQRTGKSPKILHLRNRLSKSIVYRATSSSVEVGTVVLYAAIHQFGGEVKSNPRSRLVNFRISKDGRSRFAKKSRANFQQAVEFGGGTRKIRARPFLGINQEDEREIRRIVSDYLRPE